MATVTTILRVGIIMSDEESRLAPLALLRLQSWISPAFPIGAYSYSHGIEWAVEAVDSQLDLCKRQQEDCPYPSLEYERTCGLEEDR
jgi:hypothetical protein